MIARFDYLDASASPEAGRVRAAVELMFSRYPKHGHRQLRDRLRSRDNISHLSAFFELVVHELIIRSGASILAIEPEIDGTNRSPDFLAQDQHGRRFYVEAALATGQSDQEAAAEKLWRQAVQSIDEVQSPDFFLRLERSGAPTAPIKGKELRHRVEAWLRTLNYRAIAKAWEEGGDLDTFVDKVNGVTIRLTPVPRKATRGSSVRTRSIAAGIEYWEGEAVGPIRSAIIGKAGRYGDLGLPYIVAVNALYEAAEEDLAEDALFGIPGSGISLTKGVWRSAHRPTNTRLSAVLSTERLDPWSLGYREIRLFDNPWARYPLNGISLGVDRLAVEGRELVRHQGQRLHQILGLPADWPG